MYTDMPGGLLFRRILEVIGQEIVWKRTSVANCKGCFFFFFFVLNGQSPLSLVVTSKPRQELPVDPQNTAKLKDVVNLTFIHPNEYF